MRAAAVVLVSAVGALVLVAFPAMAGLLGASVDVKFWSPDLNPQTATIPFNPIDFGSAVIVDPGVEYSGVAGSPTFNSGAAQEFISVDLTDTKIIVTNLLAGAICLNPSGNTCSDSFDGLELKFTGVQIASVSLDPASSPTFPLSGSGPSNGPNPDLVSPTDLFVNFVNDSPNVGDQLILDLTFPTTTPPTVPEPGSLLLLGAGLLGLSLARRRAKQRPAS
jgi:PEP-CTERM motif